MSTGALDTAPVPGLASIIIVNWNGGAMLLDCLRSVRAQVYAPVEILLVDNGSTDGSADRAAETFPEVRLVRSPVNRGYAGVLSPVVSTVAGFVALSAQGPQGLPDQTVREIRIHVDSAFGTPTAPRAVRVEFARLEIE